MASLLRGIFLAIQSFLSFGMSALINYVMTDGEDSPLVPFLFCVGIFCAGYSWYFFFKDTSDGG